MIKEIEHNLDLEKSVLGAAFISSEAADKVCTLRRADFYNSKHSAIFDEMCKLRKRNFFVDGLTIVNRLGTEYATIVANIMQAVITDTYLDQHMRELRSVTLGRYGIDTSNIDSIKSLIDEFDKPVIVEDPFMTAEEIEEETLEYYRKGGIPTLSTGFENLDKYYKISKGQFTTVTGMPYSGKSSFMNQITVNMAYKHDWRFIFFSPEFFPVSRHIRDIVEKYTGFPMIDGPVEPLSEKDLIDALGWVNEHFRFLKIKTENRTLDFILSQIHDCDGFIVDPWNEVEASRPINLSETEFISQSLMKIKAFAVMKNVHIWIIAHPRKMEKENGVYAVPRPYDISGSAHWFNKSDNCLSVARVGLEHRIECHIQKVRFKDCGGPGICYFDYDKPTGVFSESKIKD